MTSTKPVGIGLLRTAWVKLNRLLDWCWVIPFVRARWGLVSLPNCKCVAIEQTADHVLTACLADSIGHGMKYVVRWFLMMKPDAGSRLSLPASFRKVG